MKNITKRVLSVLFAMVMLLSVAAMTAPFAYAEETTEAQEAEKFSAVFLAEDIKLPYGEAYQCDVVVEDPDSKHGKAAMISYEARYATGDAGLYNVTIFPAGAVLTMYTCDGLEGKPAGTITSEELLENAAAGKYVVYTLHNVNMNGKSFMYLFNCWGVQFRFTDEQVSAMQGKTLDVTVSMKVTGDVTSISNPPAYYIDEVIVAEAEPHVHEYGAWSADDQKHSRICTECGEMEADFHMWGEGVVTKEATETADGEIVYSCSVCEHTMEEKLPKLGGEDEPETTPAPGTTQPQGGNMGLIIGIIMIVLAVGIVVVAVVLLKPKKK